MWRYETQILSSSAIFVDVVVFRLTIDSFMNLFVMSKKRGHFFDIYIL